MEEEIDDIGLRSESIQDIIGTNPPFIVRWGNTFMFVICIILISLCWVIKYPDVIPSQVTIKTSVTPKPLVAKVDGKILKLFVKEGSVVKKGQPLAYMESQAEVANILVLEKHLQSIDSSLKNNNWDNLRNLTLFKFNKFGEIQGAFETFFISYQTLQAYWSGNFLAGKKVVLQKEMQNLSSLTKNLSEQEREIKKDLVLAEDEYKANLNLFFEGVIPLQELRDIESKYISKKLILKQIQTNILSNNGAQYSSTKQLVDIADNIEQEKINFIRAFNLLRNELENWKNTYILIAPEDGKVSFSLSVDEYTLVGKGQELFYVLPDKIAFLGELYLDQYNLGKVENGQAVIIKLKSYPFEEYGILRGEIVNISEVDIDKKYLVRVKLTNGLTTNTNKQLRFRYGMLGDAEVITKNTLVIDKIVYKLKKSNG